MLLGLALIFCDKKDTIHTSTGQRERWRVGVSFVCQTVCSSTTVELQLLYNSSAAQESQILPPVWKEYHDLQIVFIRQLSFPASPIIPTITPPS